MRIKRPGALSSVALLGASVLVPATARAEGLQEVTVTARKYSQAWSDVAMAGRIATQSDLALQNAQDFSGLFRSTPGMSFLDMGPTGSRGGVQRLITRGIAPLPGAGDTVAGYLNEIPLNQNNLRLFDVDRVEVLLGPQGTLYGSSAMAGLYKVVTNTPILDETSFQLGADLSQTENAGANYNVNGVANLPTGSRSAARIAVYNVRESGFIDNVRNDPPAARRTIRDVNDLRDAGVTASWHLQIDADRFVTASGLYQDRRASGYSAADLRTLTSSALIDEPSRNQFAALGLTYNAKTSRGDLVATASMTDDQREQTSDGTANLRQLLPPAPLASDRSDARFRSYSFEARLRDKAFGHAEWMTGAFYIRGTAKLHAISEAPGIGNLLAAIFRMPSPGDVLFKSEVPQSGSEAGLFGEWRQSDSSDRITLALSGRLYRVQQALSQSVDGIFAAPGTSSQDNTTNGFSPRVALEWRPDAAGIVYLSAARGFRPGGANTPVPNARCAADLAVLGRATAPSKFDSDSLWTYELGVKHVFVDERISVNAAAYLIDWKDAQQLVLLPGCRQAFVDNSGRARSRGFELDIAWQALQGLGVSLGVAHIDPRFREDVPALGAVRGDRILNSEDWQANVGLQYDYTASNNSRWFVRGSYQYLGKGVFDYGPLPRELSEKPAYRVANLEAGMRVARLGVSLFVDNLTNARPSLRVDFSQAQPQAFTLRPRTTGLRLQADF